MKSPYPYTFARIDRITLAVIFISLTGWEFTKIIWPRMKESPFEITEWPWTAKDTRGEGKAGMRPSLPDEYSRFPEKDSAERNLSLSEARSATPARPVDLNTATSSELVAAGFPRPIAQNIEKYRSKGGVFRDSASILRLYGMTSAIWMRVRSSLLLPPHEPMEKKLTKNALSPNPIDLNTAYAADLEALPGIGQVLAGRVIHYRSKLRGFCSIGQIRECFGLPPDIADQITPRLTIASPHGKIRINHESLDTCNHPYAPRKIFRVIEAYKKAHGDLVTWQDLKRAYPPDTGWIARIAPYLDLSPSRPSARRASKLSEEATE